MITESKKFYLSTIDLLSHIEYLEQRIAILENIILVNGKIALDNGEIAVRELTAQAQELGMGY